MEPVRFASFAGAGNFAQKSVLNDELARAIGQKVLVDGIVHGTLKFYGKTSFAKGVWCGVEVPSGGKNDGSVNGVYYFRCPPGCGKFVPPSKVLLVKGGSKVGGNQTPSPRNTSPTPSVSAPAKLSVTSRMRPPSVQRPTAKASPRHAEISSPAKTTENGEQNMDEKGSTPIKSTARVPVRTAAQSKAPNGVSSVGSAAKSVQSAVGDSVATGAKNENGNQVQTVNRKEGREERVSGRPVRTHGQVSVNVDATPAEKGVSRFAKPSTQAPAERTAAQNETQNSDGAKLKTGPQGPAPNAANPEISQGKPETQDSAPQPSASRAETDNNTQPKGTDISQSKRDIPTGNPPSGQSLPRPVASKPANSTPTAPEKSDENPTQKPEIQPSSAGVPAPRVSPRIQTQLRTPQVTITDKSLETTEKSWESPNSGSTRDQTFSGSRIPRPTPFRERLSFASFVSSAVAAITSGFGGGDGKSEENLPNIGQEEPVQAKDANPPVVAEEVLWRRPNQPRPATPPESMKFGKSESNPETAAYAAPKSVESTASCGQTVKTAMSKMETRPPRYDPRKPVDQPSKPRSTSTLLAKLPSLSRVESYELTRQQSSPDSTSKSSSQLRGPSTPTRPFNQSQDSLLSTRGTVDGRRSPTPSMGATEELMFAQVETICQLQDELEQSQGKLGPLNTALECTASEAESATNRLHELETRLAETEKLLAACRERIRELEVASEKERQKNDEELMRTTDNWKQQLVAQNKQHGEERQSLDAAIRKLESQNSAILLGHAQELETLRRQLQQAISDRSSLESAMRTELAAMTQRHEDEVRTIRADHRERLQAVLKQRQPGEVGLLKDRIAELEGMVESLRFENERLIAAAKAPTQSGGVGGDKSTDMAHLQAEIESLTTVYELKKQECKALQVKAEQMEAMEEECRALRGKVKAMANRIEELEDSLGSRKDAEWEARQQVAKVQELLYQKEDSERRLSDQNRVLRMQLKDMQQQTPRKGGLAGPAM